MKKCLFEKEIRLFGMKRSGNSGIISYLWHLFKPNEVIHLHNTNLSLYSSRSIKSKKKNNSFHAGMEKAKGEARFFTNSIEHMPIMDIGCLLKSGYCYDYSRSRMAIEYGKEGFSEREFNLLLLRSPHNHLASVLKNFQMGPSLFFGTDYYVKFSDLWIEYAEEALSITNFIPDKIVILFDEFVSSKQYRKQISENLGVEHSDYGIDIIARDVGSSFNGKEYKHNAQKMNVLKRWKYLLNPDDDVAWWNTDDCRKELLRPKIIAYTKELFDVDLEAVFYEGKLKI